MNWMGEAGLAALKMPRRAPGSPEAGL